MNSHQDTKGHVEMKHGFDPVASHVEKVASQVIDSALMVHRTLGPGLLESVYEVCLCHEL